MLDARRGNLVSTLTQPALSVKLVSRGICSYKFLLASARAYSRLLGVSLLAPSQLPNVCGLQMLRKLQTTPVSRCLHVSATTAATAALLQRKQVQTKPRTTKPDRKKETDVEEAGVRQQQAAVSGPKRNDLGVQLLSRELHSQIFRNVSFPPPPKPFVRIAQDHLKSHGLDPSQGAACGAALLN
ncbi:hypothetical protein NUW54_g7395 [Trametes sanguinea]|uniref:Uncharacterized protein n=1 Tax=Trametes sanguinea TaxID=158606 RepID=A0ACC1PNG6_9APHY|nr:hypothetical protein NUW54_g7395 [Trametes sanguinea]